MWRVIDERKEIKTKLESTSSVKRTINISTNWKKYGNHKKKHITSLTKEDRNIVHKPKQIKNKRNVFSKKCIMPKMSVLNLPISSTFLTA